MDVISISEPLTDGIGNTFRQILSIGVTGVKYCTIVLIELSFVHKRLQIVWWTRKNVLPLHSMMGHKTADGSESGVL